MLIGGQDMVLPTTMVGNYPNPRWYDGHAFATLPKGEFIHDSISKEAFEDAVGSIVHDQEAAGLGLPALRAADRAADLLHPVLPHLRGRDRQGGSVPSSQPACGAQGYEEAGQGLLHRP